MTLPLRYLLKMLCFGFLAAPCLLHATENMYVLVGAGYAETEFADATDVGGATINFSVGYQFHPQWYLELGYKQLADESLVATTDDQQDLVGLINRSHLGLESDALYASLIGKAASRVGELFYRVGVMRVDNRGQSITTHSACELGASTAQQSVAGSSYQLCEYDEAVLAGVAGIGFDYYLGNKSMLRFEVEYASGEEDFQSAGAYIAFRYNF